MCSTIFYNEKTPVWAIKPRSSKSRKIDIFPKGLTHDFGPKMAIYPTSFFREYRPGKCVLRYCRTKKPLHDILKRKNTFLGYNNKKFKKSKN